MDKKYNYLLTSPISEVKLPIDTKKQELPLNDLLWQDFERLCLRIAHITKHSIDDCEIFGVQGSKQEGIDIFAIKGNGKYSCYQCKKYKNIYESTLEQIVNKFLENGWSKKCDEFIICSSLPLKSTKLQNKFNLLKNKLNKKGIKLIKWDKVQIELTLKEYPVIVYDFFGREWVKQYNGQDEVDKIHVKRKLDSAEVKKFRNSLLEVYSVVFHQHDPGIPSSEINNNSILLLDRFILPDSMSVIYETAKISNEKDILRTEYDYQYHSKPSDFLNIYGREHKNIEKHDVRKLRVDIDTKIANYDKSIILGDPGSGKSTLLRYIILDLLSSSPKLEKITKKWSGWLPVWLPFAFISKKLHENSNLNLEEIICLWFKSINKKDVFQIVKKALEDERLIFFIDGIDEWTEFDSALHAISQIQIQVKISNASVLYSGRPYGYRLVKDRLQGVKEINLAPFSSDQQQEYIKKWYEKWLESLGVSDSKKAENEATKLMVEISKSTDLKLLSGNPLMLSNIISLRFKGFALPSNKIKVIETICDYLIEKHPSKRSEVCGVPVIKNYEFDLSNIFQELAFFMQEKNIEGILSKSDASDIIYSFLKQNMNYADGKAKKISKELIDVGANNIGIIVEKSENEISFIHRQFQEFLVAKFIYESNNKEIIKIMKENSMKSNWHQVFLYFFGLIPLSKNEEYKKYIEAICLNEKNMRYELYLNNKLLKYEVILNNRNAPTDLMINSFSSIVNQFENETNKTVKKFYWKIILESINNPKLNDTTINYFTQYFPNKISFSDYRLRNLFYINHTFLTISQRKFLIHSILNGNQYQKLDASKAINHLIKDSWLHDKIIDLLETTYDPEILPYLLNCIITKDLDSKEKKKILLKFLKTEHPSVYFFVMKLKLHLDLLNEKDLDRFLKTQKYSHYSLQEELVEILIKGWPNSVALLQACLKSVKRISINERIIDNIETAWIILLKKYPDKKEVIDQVTYEIENEKHPFVSLRPNVIWQIISQAYKNNKRIKKTVEKWIMNQGEFREVEISVAAQISNSESIKQFLFSYLKKALYPQWIIGSILTNWGSKSDVLSLLKDYFLSSGKKNERATQFLGVVFKDDKQTGIKILEEILLRDVSENRERCVRPLIELDKEYFKKHILNKFLTNYMDKIDKNDFGQYYTALEPIIEYFHEIDSVKRLVVSSSKDDSNMLYFLVKYYPSEIKHIDKFYETSLPLDVENRLGIIEKLGEINNGESEKILESFSQEADDIIKSTAAMNYFKYLMETDPLKLEKICKEKIFYRGFDVKVQRQIAFCGYLMLKKLDVFYKSIDSELNTKPNPKFYFSSGFFEASNSIIKLLVDNIDYILEAIEGDLQKLTDDSSINYEKFWGFFADFADRNSQAFKKIIEFITVNRETITDTKLIKFLLINQPHGEILKNIVINIVGSDKKSDKVFAGEILGKNFRDDDVFSFVNDFYDYNEDIGKIIALFEGWPDSYKLEELYYKYKDDLNHVRPSIGYRLYLRFSEPQVIMKFLTRVIHNYFEAKYYHKKYFNPLQKRLSNDTILQTEIKKRLLSTKFISEKISLYELLRVTNSLDDEIDDWKKNQVDCKNINECGYNIVTNVVEPFSNTFINLEL